MTVILNETYNSVQRGYNKTVNNIKYGTALAATGAAYLAVDRDCYVAKKAGSAARFVGGKITNLLNKTSFGKTVLERSSAAKTFITGKLGQLRKLAEPLTSKISKVFNSIRESNVVKTIGEKIGKYIPKIKFKPIAAIAALITAAVLIHKHGRNSGKIDQRYEDKQLLTNGFNF